MWQIQLTTNYQPTKNQNKILGQLFGSLISFPSSNQILIVLGLGGGGSFVLGSEPPFQRSNKVFQAWSRGTHRPTKQLIPRASLTLSVKSFFITLSNNHALDDIRGGQQQKWRNWERAGDTFCTQKRANWSKPPSNVGKLRYFKTN